MLVAANLQPDDFEVVVSGGYYGEELESIRALSTARVDGFQHQLRKWSSFADANIIASPLRQQLAREQIGALGDTPQNQLHRKLHWLMGQERRRQPTLPRYLERATFTPQQLSLSELPQTPVAATPPYQKTFFWFNMGYQRAQKLESPVAILTRDDHGAVQIVDGHARIAALRDLAEKAVGATSFKMETEHIPVLMVDPKPYNYTAAAYDGSSLDNDLSQVLQSRNRK